MKFSTTTLFMVAFVMTFASTFGLENNVEPDMTVIDEAMYHRDMAEVNAGNGDRALQPPITCYTKWCKGKVRGTCYIVYPICFPL
jgi:hypothetical protein